MFGDPTAVLDPIDLPGPAAVRRIGLLEVSRRQTHVLPHTTNVDGSSLKLIRGVRQGTFFGPASEYKG